MKIMINKNYKNHKNHSARENVKSNIMCIVIYNDLAMICANSNMALLRVRN